MLLTGTTWAWKVFFWSFLTKTKQDQVPPSHIHSTQFWLWFCSITTFFWAPHQPLFIFPSPLLLIHRALRRTGRSWSSNTSPGSHLPSNDSWCLIFDTWYTILDFWTWTCIPLQTCIPQVIALEFDTWCLIFDIWTWTCTPHQARISKVIAL